MKSFWSKFLLSTAILAIATFLTIQYLTKKKIEQITYDKEIDESDLILCDDDRVGQYYMFSTDYNGGKRAIKHKLLPIILNDQISFGTQSGNITVRFIVNCKGEIGLFRAKAIDENQVTTNFDNTEYLISVVQQLNDWIVENRKDKKYDSYYFINFKITNGLVTDIF